jgi:hypothetical protein
MSENNDSKFNSEFDKAKQKELKDRVEHVKDRMNIADQKLQRDFKNASKNDYKPPEVYQIDREGFAIIDQQYQKEIIEIRRKITEKWTLEFQKKQYVGSKELQNKARAFDKEQRDQKVAEEFEANRKKIELFHFGQESRDNILKRFQKEMASEKQKEATLQKDDKAQKSEKQNQMLKDHDAKNIYQLAREIVLKQQQANKKNRKR